MIKICDQIDCPLYSDQLYETYEHIQPPINSTNSSSHSYSNIVNNSDIVVGGQKTFIVLNEQSIKFKTPNVEGHVECLFCKYKIYHDMKTEIISNKAKNLLQGE